MPRRPGALTRGWTTRTAVWSTRFARRTASRSASEADASALGGQRRVGFFGRRRCLDGKIRFRPAGAGDAAEGVVLAMEAAAHVDHAGVPRRLEGARRLERSA